MEVCPSCGQLQTAENKQALYDVYERIRDGRSRWEPLVYTRDEYEDSWDDDYETNWAMVAMEKNMYERGLCPQCGYPDLRGVKEEDIMDEEEAKEMHDMWAEQEQERRMGC
jgi:hypothetical protein